MVKRNSKEKLYYVPILSLKEDLVECDKSEVILRAVYLPKEEISDLPYTHNGLKFILKSNPFLNASILSEKNHELFNYCDGNDFS